MAVSEATKTSCHNLLEVAVGEYVLVTLDNGRQHSAKVVEVNADGTFCTPVHTYRAISPFTAEEIAKGDRVASAVPEGFTVEMF